MNNQLQDDFLNRIRKHKTLVTIFLSTGTKLQGTVIGFDNFSLMLKRHDQIQLVYKNGLVTIVPMDKSFWTTWKSEVNTKPDIATKEQPL